MDSEDKPPRRRPSFVTDALRRIERDEETEEERSQGWSLLQENDRRRLLQMCYLWPLTCCGFFLPFIVYFRFRQDEEIAIHSRHGVLLATGYIALLFVLGFIHGLVGRLVVDWVNVSLACSAVLVVVVAVLTGFGLRWYRRALREQPVDIPFVTSLAERF